jgi:hypothetical protein
MKQQALPLIAAALLGFAAAGLLFGLWGAPAARAQGRNNTNPPLFGQIPTLGAPAGAGAQLPPQPIAIQALDAEHFVVATREARLVQQIGREGTAQSMLVTVVTHYTVRGDRLLPVEHVRVPTGYRPVTIEE